MRRMMAIVLAGACWLGYTSAADAQVVVRGPFGGGVAVGNPYGVYGSGYYPSTFVAPGYYGGYAPASAVTYYSSGYYGYAPTAATYSYPAYGTVYSTGYAPTFYGYRRAGLLGRRWAPVYGW
jgi:hypothetical protein